MGLSLDTAHLKTPVSACAPAGKNRDMAPANTSFHGLSGKQTEQIRERPLWPTLSSSAVSLCIEEKIDCCGLILFYSIAKQTIKILQKTSLLRGKYDFRVAHAQGKSSEGG